MLFQWRDFLRTSRKGTANRPRRRAFRPEFDVLEQRICPVAKNYLVTDAGDNGGAMQLRAAISLANTNNDPGDTITFSFNAQTTITLQQGTLDITTTMSITGQADPVFQNRPKIRIDGGGTTATCFNVTAANVTISTLNITNFTNDAIDLASGGRDTVKKCFIGTSFDGTAAVGTIGGNDIIIESANNIIGSNDTAQLTSGNLISNASSYGVYISGVGAHGNVVGTNLIGTTLDGNGAIGNGAGGVIIAAGADNNTIGGALTQTASTLGNYISGNTGNGITINGSGTSNNLITNNYIGLKKDGSAALANSGAGVSISDHGANNNIGGVNGMGMNVGRNVISGNGGNGISIDDTSHDNQLIGNTIGMKPAGDAAIANGAAGVYIQGYKNNIGGTSSGQGNLISGNTTDGVYITGSPSSGNLVAGNLIGTDSNGTAKKGNGKNGIRITNSANNNTIGGATANARNVISGNGFSGSAPLDNNGIAILYSGSSGNVIQGNYIGTDINGTAALGNKGDGVFIQAASNNTIGGTAAAAGNVISANGGYGVDVTSLNSQNNYIDYDIIGLDKNGNVVAALKNTSGWFFDSGTNTTWGTHNQHQ
jgi:titin